MTVPDRVLFNRSMTNSLQKVIKAIASATTETELRSIFMDTVGNYLEVQRWGIYLLDDRNRLASVNVRGVSDRFVSRYEKIGQKIDPLLNYVREYHTPVHEQLVFGQTGWKQSLLYQNCCVRENHEHIMTGPIVGNGNLIGTVHFARVEDTPAFDRQNLADLGAICLHISANLASIRAKSVLYDSSLAQYLTKRELQIAELVAQGLTNSQIGAQLWISQNTVKQALKRIFRKLEVSSRLEMVIKLRSIL